MDLTPPPQITRHPNWKLAMIEGPHPPSQGAQEPDFTTCCPNLSSRCKMSKHQFLFSSQFGISHSPLLNTESFPTFFKEQTIQWLNGYEYHFNTMIQLSFNLLWRQTNNNFLVVWQTFLLALCAKALNATLGVLTSKTQCSVTPCYQFVFGNSKNINELCAFSDSVPLFPWHESMS